MIHSNDPYENISGSNHTELFRAFWTSFRRAEISSWTKKYEKQKRYKQILWNEKWLKCVWLMNSLFVRMLKFWIHQFIIFEKRTQKFLEWFCMLKQCAQQSIYFYFDWTSPCFDMKLCVGRWSSTFQYDSIGICLSSSHGRPCSSVRHGSARLDYILDSIYVILLCFKLIALAAMQTCIRLLRTHSTHIAHRTSKGDRRTKHNPIFILQLMNIHAINSLSHL